MKKIFTSVLIIICLQGHSQLAYDVLDISSFSNFTVVENQFNTTAISAKTGNTSPSLSKNELNWKSKTNNLLTIKETVITRYLSTIALKESTTTNESVLKNNIVHPFARNYYRTDQETFFKWLKPIHTHHLSLPSNQQLPKGFGPSFQI